MGAMPALVAEAAPRGLLLARTGRKGWSESSSQGMEPSLTMSNKRVSPSLSFPLTRFLPHWFICPRLGTGSPLELHLVWLAGSVNQKSYFMAAIFGWATHRDGEETPRNPTVDSGASPGNPPVNGGNSPGDSPAGIWTGVKHLIDEWAPPQNWRKVETPKAVMLILHEITDCLGGLSDCGAAGTVGWLFLMALERTTKERDALQCCLDELRDEL